MCGPLSPSARNGTPCPDNLKGVPLCVPAGTFIVIFQSTVSTSISQPSAASTMLIFSSDRIIVPSLVKLLCGFTLILTYKSPLSPPFGASPPLPRNLIDIPSSIPAGTFIFISWPSAETLLVVPKIASSKVKVKEV